MTKINIIDVTDHLYSNLKKYHITNDIIKIDDKVFNVSKNAYSNLVAYLNKKNISFTNDILCNLINEKCIICDLKINNCKISRGLVIVDTVCEHCRKKYNISSKNFVYKKKCKLESCDNTFFNFEKTDKFCSDGCLTKNRIISCKKNMVKYNKDNHWSKIKTESEVREIYKKIGNSGKNTKSKMSVIAWNKGKTMPIEYCEKNRISQLKFWNDLTNEERELRKERHRKIAFKNMEQYKHQTKIELKIENLLKDLINKKMIKSYKYSFILKNRQFDFVVNENIIIEVHGDYWHGNTSIPKFKNLTDRQKMKKLDDKIKEKLAKDNGYKYFYFWENDINNNFKKVENKILEIINE